MTITTGVWTEVGIINVEVLKDLSNLVVDFDNPNYMTYFDLTVNGVDPLQMKKLIRKPFLYSFDLQYWY